MLNESRNLKLARYGKSDSESPAIIGENRELLDVSLFGEDYNEIFFATNGIDRLKKWLIDNRQKCEMVSVHERLASCVCRPSKIVGIGLNYTKHAEESGLPIPKEPIVFMKSSTCLCGPNDNVIIPPGSVKTDWEAELAIVIGKKASYIKETDAHEYIAGYSIMNDYSERENQIERGGTWDKGKSADTFGPMGPYLLVPSEGFDPRSLRIWLKVNDEMIQDSNTADMIFDVFKIVSYVSQFMTLLPGDIIATGTPAGVGLGFKPPRFLKAGDRVELGIDQLGTQNQTAISYKH